MLHSAAAYHLGLHCLQMYPFRGFRSSNGVGRKGVFGPVFALVPVPMRFYFSACGLIRYATDFK